MQITSIDVKMLDAFEFGTSIHRRYERILNSRRHWRAIARALGLFRSEIRDLARIRQGKNIPVTYSYATNGSVDGYMINSPLRTK